MISFVLSLVALVLGYLLYGKLIERIFKIDTTRKTPAYAMQDGVDYIPMPTWKVYMIQFLNIAGTGPIFGAIMGSLFGISSFLWIVFGCIFGGAVHDYLSGMLSVRHEGESLPQLIGRYLGTNVKRVMLVFSVVLLVLVGAVFVSSPAMLLAEMTPDPFGLMFWIIVVFIYYVIATLLPIDKIIGKIYPVFAFALLFMAVGLIVMLFVNHPALPEFWDGLSNTHADPDKYPIFPCLFITIACGAISGFHATQSPLMARCIKNERYGRPVFYGSMITEGVVALVWAAAATYFYHDNPANLAFQAPQVVTKVCSNWMGALGSILAILGVVAAPITSGDTAFRSARLIIADFIHLDQHPIRKRLYISVPLFLVAIVLLIYNLGDANGFAKIWSYFAWSNQTLSVFTLWAITSYLVQAKKAYLVSLIPALFMTMVCSTYIFEAPEGFQWPAMISRIIGAVVTLALFIYFLMWKKKIDKELPARG